MGFWDSGILLKVYGLLHIDQGPTLPNNSVPGLTAIVAKLLNGVLPQSAVVYWEFSEFIVEKLLPTVTIAFRLILPQRQPGLQPPTDYLNLCRLRYSSRSHNSHFLGCGKIVAHGSNSVPPYSATTTTGTSTSYRLFTQTSITCDTARTAFTPFNRCYQIQLLLISVTTTSAYGLYVRSQPSFDFLSTPYSAAVFENTPPAFRLEFLQQSSCSSQILLILSGKLVFNRHRTPCRVGCAIWPKYYASMQKTSYN